MELWTTLKTLLWAIRVPLFVGGVLLYGLFLILHRWDAAISKRESAGKREPEEPPFSADRNLIGATGKTRSVLNPMGTAIVQGHNVEAKSLDADFIEAGVSVKVVDAVGNTVIVERIANLGQEEGES